MSLESKNYVATLEDVARLTRDVLTARKEAENGRATFLCAVIATTQAELGLNPRQRAAGSNGKLNAEEREEQLAALEAVGKRFYDVVVKTARELIDTPDKGGRMLQKRTAFARSSLSTVRKWIRHGGDITSLVAARTTKGSLYISGRKKGPSVKVLGNQTRRWSTKLEHTLAAFASADPEAAKAQWERVRAAMDRVFRRNAGVPRGRGRGTAERPAA